MCPELDEAIRVVEQARDYRYHGGHHQSGRHQLPKAGTKRKQERGTGQDERLPPTLRMEVWKPGIQARRHQKQRIEVVGQVANSEFLRNVGSEKDNSAIKEASVTHFVEPNVNQGGENESGSEPSKFAKTRSLQVGKQRPYRPD